MTRGWVFISDEHWSTKKWLRSHQQHRSPREDTLLLFSPGPGGMRMVASRVAPCTAMVSGDAYPASWKPRFHPVSPPIFVFVVEKSIFVAVSPLNHNFWWTSPQLSQTPRGALEFWQVEVKGDRRSHEHVMSQDPWHGTGALKRFVKKRVAGGWKQRQLCVCVHICVYI